VRRVSRISENGVNDVLGRMLADTRTWLIVFVLFLVVTAFVGQG